MYTVINPATGESVEGRPSATDEEITDLLGKAGEAGTVRHGLDGWPVTREDIYRQPHSRQWLTLVRLAEKRDAFPFS